MYKIILTLLLPIAVMGQDLHPTSTSPSCCSERTGIPYSFQSDGSSDFMPIYAANKFSEKSVFYYGKYDPWKNSEYSNSDLYNQRYIVPPGTIPIAKGKFLDQTELANIHFEEFLFFVEKDSGRYSSKAYLARQENKYVLNYFKNSEFAFYPVLSISYETAQSYCRWRADKLNEGLEDMLEGEPNKYKFSGRLPTKEEWLSAAGSYLDEIEIASHEVNKKGGSFLQEDIVKNRFSTASAVEKSLFLGYNVNLMYTSGGAEIDIPQYIYSFKPNKKGFYNLYGNVKELVDEAYAIGGSFRTSNEEEDLFEEDEVQSYRTDVGFRCLVEVKRR